MNYSEFDEAYEDQQRIRGAILATPIRDLLVRAPIQVEATASVAEAVEAMNEHHTGCVLVTRDGKLVGIFTERDVLTRVIYQTDSPMIPVVAVMTPNPETLFADEAVAFALNKMSVGGYRHIPIVDRSGRAVAVLSVRDVVDFLVELFPEGVLNLPPNTETGISRTADGG